MSTTTTNYGLVKPELTDAANITAMNVNWDTIDTKLKDLENADSTSATNLNSHTTNKSNPHEVTKSQVGLGNVPNVATNDQTPTYTAASTLATLTSGEKLSVSMGKIMKAITDLISHIGNKSNPHSVTKSQIGLGNVDNTADANKPVSTAQATAISDAKKAGTDAQTALSTHTADTTKHITAAERTAWNGKAPGTHASQHASTGADPITPASIGAAPAYTYGTTDLTAGTSTLETGKLYFVYE